MTSTVEFEAEWFTDLPNDVRGEFGEAIVRAHLQTLLRKEPEVLFPQFSDVPDGEPVLRTRHGEYLKLPRKDPGERDHRWLSDLKLRLRHFPKESSGPELDETVAVEVKTGRSASLKQNQKRVM